MFSNDDLPRRGTATIHSEGRDEPTLEDVPLTHMSVHEDTLYVGDDFGMRVASFPFVDAEPLSDHQWRFVGPTEDFTLTINPSGESRYGDVQ